MDDAQHTTARFIRLSPEHVFDEVEVIGRRCTGRYLVLNSYENRVYSFEMEEGGDVVGKFYRPGRWSRAAIEEEHAFVAELAEAEIPAVAPLDLGGGRTVGETRGGILYALFPRVRGRTPQEVQGEQVEVLGRLLARMHGVGAARDAPHRRRLTPQTYGRESLAELVEREVIPPGARGAYLDAARAVLDRVEPRFEGVPTQRIHGDCHLGNLIEAGSSFCFLDFDDLVVGPAVQDVWMLAPGIDRESVALRDRLLDAYEELREFDWGQLRLIEPLRALRVIHYAAWIARRWEDPLFPRVFPHFGTTAYWQQEAQELQDQLTRL